MALTLDQLDSLLIQLDSLLKSIPGTALPFHSSFICISQAALRKRRLRASSNPASPLQFHQFSVVRNTIMPEFRYYQLKNESSTTVQATITPNSGDTLRVSGAIAPGAYWDTPPNYSPRM